jgi:hypothetical protein
MYGVSIEGQSLLREGIRDSPSNLAVWSGQEAGQNGLMVVGHRMDPSDPAVPRWAMHTLRAFLRLMYEIRRDSRATGPIKERPRSWTGACMTALALDSQPACDMGPTLH